MTIVFMIRRRDALRLMGGAFGLGAYLLTPEEAEAYPLVNHPSPKRRTRPDRKSTKFIVLHTTEAGGSSSLASLTKGGKANYLVDTDGKVYMIMGRNQVSIGCGRSMWDESANLDNHAINIENVGYHNRPLTARQYASLKDLLSDLRKEYRVDDEDVMPHSQVAYGRPNKWHRKSHRGRKRCGMLFATESVREKLGMDDEHSTDPDVREGRLVVADSYLNRVIYGDAREAAPPAIAEAEPPAPRSSPDEDVAIRTVEKGQNVWQYAGDEYPADTTIYLLKNGWIRRGDELLKEGFDFNTVPAGTRMAVGYMYGGHIRNNRSAYSVVGRDWNRPETLYIFDGKIMTGDDISSAKIPDGTLVLFRR